MGGIASTHELLDRGFTPGHLRFASKRGLIYRPRKGWYASASLPPEAIRCWRVGGRAACLTAAKIHGLWVPDHNDLHVEVKHTDSRLRAPTDRSTRLAQLDDAPVVVHWCSLPSAGGRFVVSVRDCVRQVFECAGRDAGFAVLESALHLNKIDLIDFHELISTLPRQFRSVARRATHESDSGSESYLKLILLDLGVPFRQQAVIADRWPVDFLIGAHLALEADSIAHHSEPYRDRKKDAELSEAAVRVLRFMYSQIRYERPAVERAILAALVRGDATNS